MPIRRLEKTYTGTTSTIGGDEIAASTIPVKPHIQPGVLQPAVAGKDLSGTALSGSYVYGTAHTDGHSYYYTDIKGSKPIKDPRIGAHFGSQRYKFTSFQTLEQETATHGDNVYSIDGRENIRGVGISSQQYNERGTYLYVTNGTATDVGYFEIVGYFSDANYLGTADSVRSFSKRIDGGSATTITDMTASIGTPLTGRYVTDASLIRLSLGVTLGIHTLRISNINGHHFSTFGVELIAQDTTSTATRSKIQIHAQNVVSYGKKFSLSAAAQHYNPFDGMSGAKTLAQLGDYIDTATSLGMENWKAGTANYYKPFNGGRVVKWVDSSGTIKTSVSMMPPNAQNIGGTASNPVTNTEVQNGTNGETINFDTTTIANATPLSEVAKTYHVTEFGNGAANGGTGHASYADVSMMSGSDDVTYVMDDGLTSLVGDDVEIHADRVSGLRFNNPNKTLFITFIGTGISVLRNESNVANGNDQFHYTVDGVLLTTYSASNSPMPKFINIAQNLPYGTHILKISVGTVSNYGRYWKDFSFHQPKMPLIPEDACIIADYMLMADFVPVPSASGIGSIHNNAKISKGVRYNHASRDTFFATNESIGYTSGNVNAFLGSMYYNSAASFEVKHVGFGHAFGEIYFQDTNRPGDCMVKLDGSNYTETGSNEYQSGDEWGAHSDGAITKDDDTGGNAGFNMFGIKGQTLGVHTFGDAKQGGSGSEYQNVAAWETATPIHTSSHYQTFETPFLKELVGGDRNMEQNNLVVTADGKSWDEVTRDTSYIGDMALQLMSDTSEIDSGTAVVMDECRGFGTDSKKINQGNKDFAIAYDRQICLRDGEYEFHLGSIVQTSASQEQFDFKVNGNAVAKSYTNDNTWTHGHLSGIVHLKRGDYVQVFGGYWGNNDNHHSEYYIRRLK